DISIAVYVKKFPGRFTMWRRFTLKIPLDNCQPIRVLDPGDPVTTTSAIVRVRLDFAGSILGKGPPTQTTCYVQSQDTDNPVQQVVASCPKSKPPTQEYVTRGTFSECLSTFVDVLRGNFKAASNQSMKSLILRVSPPLSGPSHFLGSRSIQTPLEEESLPRTQEHPDTFGGRVIGPRASLEEEDPGASRHLWRKRTQEHPDIFGGRGPRSIQTSLEEEDPGASRHLWRKSHFLGPRCTQTPLDQETSRCPPSKVEMGRHQCKNTYNNIKNKTSPESSPPPTPRPEHCNVDKAEENDLKNSLMKMLEEAYEGKILKSL
ncbi:hypothetical protein STEG23_024662, partial [Scotinomys teguina]